MKMFYPAKQFMLTKLALVFIVMSITQSVNAQQLQMSEFALFGFDGLRSGCTPPLSPGPGVLIGGGSAITCGSTGSYELVKTSGPVTFGGAIHSKGKVILVANNTVNGKISAANVPAYTTAVLQVSNGANLSGNIDVNGKITIGTGTVSGKVTHPVGSTYTGPIPALGNIIGVPSLPTLPVVPAATVFAPAGITNITTTQTIVPGAYNNLTLSGNKTITFSGPGVYVFNSIKHTGSNFNKYVFDFNNTTSGNFLIYVHGDVNVNKLNVDLVNGGNASRIYAETHGTGITSPTGTHAWMQNNGMNGLRKSEWFGTVWAPYAAINIGTSTSYCNITGALWSGTQVNIQKNVTISCAPFGGCVATADAGSDGQLDCSIDSISLSGTSSTINAQYSWTAINGGHILSGANTLNPFVSNGGKYVLTVTNPLGGCTAKDTTQVIFIPCIIPYFEPPAGGKTYNIIGSELSSLSSNPANGDTTGNIFIITNDSVWIEVIALANQYNTLLALLQTPPYGITDLIFNGSNTLIISGKYPIASLLKLDSLPTLIDYCRPLFPPVSNIAANDSGATYTRGDIAILGDAARGGFSINGNGIKVGVISDSYNTVLGSPAPTDVVNGDLPGAGNINYPTPVNVLKEYPFGRRTDEGRAMLQIVHDVAPGADLAFRTGFVSAGDFAEGIKQLQQDNCDVIVDDVTFITEPFFQDGVVAKAVNEVTALGVSYFSAAGNFGKKSYQKTFAPITPPVGIVGSAHDFGGGDILQGIALTPGNYTIVLQWQDSIYSLGQTQTGTQNDLDIYLTNNVGSTLFGFNRNNIAGDPLEVLPFTVTQNTTANIMIIRAVGTANVNFKYIVFRGELAITEHNEGTSTIVGQANSEGAMAVGAVLYLNTPVFGVNPPTIASFSSTGGTPVNGVVRSKPDFAAPNGGNTSVDLGGPNIDGDLFHNFFGTSAAAPHAAGAAALILDAKNKFTNSSLTPSQMRTLLQNTSINMYAAGLDSLSGSGLIQANAAIETFASPTPLAESLIVPPGVTPRSDAFDVIVKGKYFTPQSVVYFRGLPLTTTPLSSTQLSAPIPLFTGNPPIQVYNPPLTINGDGGFSDSLFFFAPVTQTITVIAETKTKRYGESLPVFSLNVFIDGQPLASTGLTLADIGLGNIQYTSTGNALSNTGVYIIQPFIDALDPLDPVDAALLELYEYEFTPAFLVIEKLPLVIQPRDTTITYGDKIADLGYVYQFDSALIDPTDQINVLLSLQSDHDLQMADELVLVDAKNFVNGRALNDSDLVNMSLIASTRAIINARNFVNVNVNSVQIDTTKLIDVAVESVFNYQVDSANGVLVNARNFVNARSFVNARNFVNGTATVNARNFVNGAPLVNSNNVNNQNNENILVVIDEDDVNAVSDTINDLKSVMMITGITVGEWAIIPGAFLSANFDITYQKGKLTINPDTLIVTAHDTSRYYGTQNPAFTFSYSGFHYEDGVADIITEPIASTVADINYLDGNYPISLAGGVADNYIFNYVEGTLSILYNACYEYNVSQLVGGIDGPILINTDDENLCTIDGCEPLTGVFHTTVNVDDNNICTIDACDPFYGESHAPVYVTDENECTIDGCDPVTGPYYTLVNVDDGLDCTVDNCNQLDGTITHDADVLGNIIGIGKQCVPALSGTANFSIAPLLGITTYNWTVPTGLTIIGGAGTTAITVKWNSSFGHFGLSGLICVDATNACGLQQSCLKFEINSALPVTPGSISGPAKVCPGDFATYSITYVSRATGYIWVTPPGVVILSGQNTASINVEVKNGYSGGALSVAANNICGTGSARTKNLGLNIPPIPVTISGPSSGLCNSSGVLYSLGTLAVPALAGVGSQYSWSVSGGTIVGANTNASIVVDWGSFTTGFVTVTQINGCSSSTPRTLNTTGTPARPGIINGLTEVCTYFIYPYEIATVSGAASYLWTSPTGTTISGQGAKNIDVTFAGNPAMNQVITVKATNTCGSGPARSLSGIIINHCSARLADQEISSKLSVYPNPATGKAIVQFSAEGESEVHLSICTPEGKLLYNLFNASVVQGEYSTIELNVAEWNNGVYLIQLKQNNNSIFTKLIIAK